MCRRVGPLDVVPTILRLLELAPAPHLTGLAFDVASLRDPELEVPGPSPAAVEKAAAVLGWTAVLPTRVKAIPAPSLPATSGGP